MWQFGHHLSICIISIIYHVFVVQSYYIHKIFQSSLQSLLWSPSRQDSRIMATTRILIFWTCGIQCGTPHCIPHGFRMAWPVLLCWLPLTSSCPFQLVEWYLCFPAKTKLRFLNGSATEDGTKWTKLAAWSSLGSGAHAGQRKDRVTSVEPATSAVNYFGNKVAVLLKLFTYRVKCPLCSKPGGLATDVV